MTLEQNKEEVSALYIQSAKSYATLGEGEEVTETSFLKSRTVSLKLKKGETVYMDFGLSGAAKGLYDLKIK